MIQPEHHDTTAVHALALLSARESEVLGMASRGLTNSQIAHGLDLSVHAVKFHLASIYRKLGVRNRTEAAVALVEVRGEGAGAGGAGGPWT